MAALASVQQAITRYVLPTILAFGNLGNLLTIAIYCQQRYRTNSCSIYLIAVSCFSLMGANWAIVPTVYALNHYDMVSNSIILCRIRGYIIHTSSMCFRYTLVLLCIDRYASCHPRAAIRALCRPQIALRSICFLTILVCADRYAFCSTRASIRAFSRPMIAYRSIVIVTIFWATVSVHLLIWESIENGRCGVYGLYGQIFSFYIAVCTGLIPIFSMITFGLLLLKNLPRSRLLVHPANSINQLNRRDVSFIKLVLIEIIIYIICTLTYPAMTIYIQVTSYMQSSKSVERRQIESFINYITMSLLLYLNYNTTFYVHLMTSKTFRNEVKQLILRCMGKAERNFETQQNIMHTGSTRQRRQL